MAWIEAHQGLSQHPKTKRLARMLNISIREAVGSLFMFWWWAMEYAEDGDLSKYDSSDIADAVQWDGNAEEFLNALINCGPGESYGFIEKTEDGMFIHDWEDFGGRYFEKREKNRQRQQRFREKNLVTRYENVTPKSVTRESQGYIREEEITEDKITEEEITREKITEEEQTTPTHHPDDDAVKLREIISCWNERLVPLGFPGILKNTPAREKALKARINISPDRKKLEWWQTLFERIAMSDFLKSSAQERSWFSLDWLLNENNLVKVLEGKYDNRSLPVNEMPPVRSFDEILAGYGSTIEAEYEVKTA